MNVKQEQLHSREWIHHFELNAAYPNYIPTKEEALLTETERARLTASIQQFQLGEGSEGRSLFKRATEFANKTEDRSFVQAIQLFIKEEQRHSTLLAAFMNTHNIPLLKGHWVDRVFRCLRRLATLEMSVVILVTAEIIAKPYYRALRGATTSPMLKAICKQVLRDEEHHLMFQASTLSRLRGKRSTSLLRICEFLHSILLTGTILVVWWQHRAVFQAGNCTFVELSRECFDELQKLFARAHPKTQQEKNSALLTPRHAR